MVTFYVFIVLQYYIKYTSTVNIIKIEVEKNIGRSLHPPCTAADIFYSHVKQKLNSLCHTRLKTKLMNPIKSCTKKRNLNSRVEIKGELMLETWLFLGQLFVKSRRLFLSIF